MLKELIYLATINRLFTLVPRTEWGAREPTEIEHFDGPSPFVIIHHSSTPPACNTSETCQEAMRSMQDYHQLEHGWNDLGYSFAVGGDGKVYEGRGFNVIGAHAPGYNSRSVGICMIGNWRTELPNPEMIDTVQAFIDYGVQNGFIESNYTLLGHRQVRDTDCPGDTLFEEISTWPHFSVHPTGPEDNSTQT